MNSDCILSDLNIIYNLITTASKSNREDKVELPGLAPEEWVKPEDWVAVLRKSVAWRVTSVEAGLRKDPGETTQAKDDIVWEHCDETKNGNGIDCRLSWRNRGESNNCTRVLQHVWFFIVTNESRTKA